MLDIKHAIVFSSAGVGAVLGYLSAEPMLARWLCSFCFMLALAGVADFFTRSLEVNEDEQPR